MGSAKETGDLDKELPNIFDRQIYKDIALAFIIFVVIISAFLINYGIKIRNNEYCTSDLLIDERTTQSLESTNILNSTDSSFLQKFYWHPNDFEVSKDYSFCYSGRANSSRTLSLNVVNQNSKVLANDFVLNGSISDKCVFLTNKLNLNNGDYVGLQCTDCDENNYLVLKQHLLGEEQELLYNGQKIVDTGLFYDFQYTKNCKPMFKKMINAFFTVAGLFLLIMLLLIGVRWLRDTLAKGWGF